MWRANLQDNYKSLREFKHYDEIYNLASRLEFSNAKQAWDANPLIQGSVNPSDFGVVPQYCRIRKDIQKQNLGVPLEQVAGTTYPSDPYIRGGAKRQYRWLSDTSGFQIKHKGKWYYAYSIDFDFI